VEFNTFTRKIFQKSRDIFEEAEIFRVESENLKIGVFKGELDKFSFSNTSGVSLRGILNGSPGYSYTEAIDDKSVDILIEGALSSAESVETDTRLTLPEAGESFAAMPEPKNKLNSITTEDKIKAMLQLEEKTLSRDSRIQSVQECMYQEFKSRRIVRNSKGLDLEHSDEGGFAYVSVVSRNGTDTKTGSSYRLFRNPLEMDIDKMSEEAAEESLSMLGASPVASGMYPAVIRHNVFAELLEAFSPIFSADNVQKGLSGLKGKLGMEIASSGVTLIDDPFHKDGFSGSSFDDEGIPTSRKLIVESGVLRTYLHNIRTAEKDMTESTGNGFRTSYKTAIGVSPTNFYMEPGEHELEELLERADGGILITKVAGIHSGLDTISGDFSVQAQGYLIKKGKKEDPVNGITISGNFYDLLLHVEEIGSDLKFTLPGNGHFGSPSVLVGRISISGI